jgi:indole-3-glycerol phosphate synthase
MKIHSFLQKIVDLKKNEIESLYSQFGIDYFRDKLSIQNESLPNEFIESKLKKKTFKELLSGNGLSLISEIKKASPSKGIIRKDFDPLALASEFEKSGASAFSILTEIPHFQGHPDYLRAVRKQSLLPILRKDFLLDPIQLYEAKEMGADAILLIKTLLTDDQSIELSQLAKSLNMDVLMEVHDEEELLQVLSYDLPFIIGINNRNLSTFDTDINRAVALKRCADKKGYQGLLVAESGYSTVSQLQDLDNEGFSAVLVGEGLAKNPEMMEYFSK